MNLKKVLIQIVTYNSERSIIACIEAIKMQIGDFEKRVVIIDNHSSDRTIDLIKASYPHVEILENEINLGYAGGHNKGIRELEEFDFLLTLNPDVRLAENYIKIIIDNMTRDVNVGMASGLLLRSNKEIDSIGIGLKRNRRAYDVNQGTQLAKLNLISQYNFGPCGAAAVYSRAFVEDLIIENNFFDEDFFVYKEDVDICWRGQLLGWKSLFIPEATAVHDRGWKKDSRVEIKPFIKVHSFKNRYLLIVKNDDVINILYHLPWILLFELAALGYLFFKEPYLLQSWSKLIPLLPKALQKRKKIMAKRKVSRSEIRSWFK